MRFSAYKSTEPVLILNGSPRELELLDLLRRYDILPSDFIYKATGNYHATRTLLTRLTKGGYIGFPELPYQEKLAYIPRNSNYVYELKAKGKALLALKNCWRDRSRGNDHFKHKLLRSKAEFALDHCALRILYPEDILAHPNCPQSTRNERYPWHITASKPSLAPDITRGFEYQGSYAFLHVEVDRGTEPEETENERQSICRKLERYQSYLENRVYYKRYGLTGAPTVLFLTISDLRKEQIKRHAKKYSHPRFAFACVPDLKPDTQLLSTWEALEGTINLMELLNGHAESTRPRREAREDRAGAGDY
jgi:Replication-relaxation